MAGIEKITEAIALDAEKKAAEIIETAKKEAEAILNNAKEECRIFSEEQKAVREKAEKIEDGRTASQKEQVLKLRILKEKQEIIELVLAKAKEKLLNKSDSDYTELLLSMVEKSALGEMGEVLLNKKDKTRVSADFIERADEIAKKKGGSLTMSTDEADIDGGLILRYGRIEINSSIESVFDENREHLVDVVNKVLW